MGVGGAACLAEFMNQAEGDHNQLMVNGITTASAILTNKSLASLDQITPSAHFLTDDPLFIVVPATSR